MAKKMSLPVTSGGTKANHALAPIVAAVDQSNRRPWITPRVKVTDASYMDSLQIWNQSKSVAVRRKLTLYIDVRPDAKLIIGLVGRLFRAGVGQGLLRAP
jgi:hypothetical protein